jgi:hypothetical protein
VPVVLAGVGPGREQIVWNDKAAEATAYAPAAAA